MYNELPIIKKLNKKDKIKIVLLFIQEYSGWLQHLQSVGLKWGAGGEEVGANKEIVKVKNHLKKLESLIIHAISNYQMSF